ncbi:hypothetical protein NKDENANG_03112 [Candidatus Entotheonellaceae bacterium PAL068K]
MEVVRLVAQKRHRTGKGVARQLRRAGMLPAVLYGHGDSIAITVSYKDFVDIHRSGRGENTILNLEVQGEEPETCNVMLREVQIDALTGSSLHVDFYRLDMNQPVTVAVSLEFTNAPDNRFRAAQASWLPLMREIEVTCLPGDIPAVITVDLAELNVGTTIVAGALALPQSVTLALPADKAVVTTTLVTAEIVADVEVAEEADGGTETASEEGASEA